MIVMLLLHINYCSTQTQCQMRLLSMIRMAGKWFSVIFNQIIIKLSIEMNELSTSRKYDL